MSSEIEDHLRLVASQARRFRGRGLPFSDLVQEGAVGLVQAAARFDPARGVPFGAYALHWIERAMNAAVQRQGPAPSLSVRDARRAAKLRVLEGDDESLAARLDTSPERVAALRLVTAPSVPLDRDALEAEEPWPEVLRAEVARELERALSALPEREQIIVRRRYGLGTDVPETFVEIARSFGLTPERVRQLERGALARLAEDEGLRAWAA
ncbi:sigma-70 family RNA polymerase sigma factor [Solirubrobacter sp. CPCC 204708]|uniref:RNA polymerase sigma factor n=1 Tax=Solirubrobacter deserti TaxID=2282478 RepID=A0ABT4RP78_9ACTN|nr:sigma-70 family RNA polymerase sigma factor [Solirubrobacter deserti]MBE2315746.1 sigma-70 family RNA polymerase sigma factor [Solirubrobacter deserti]MDA0140364.1 sigma-70 family RNA polymerase sigma factor [Solirubrobacter deserti]